MKLRYLLLLTLYLMVYSGKTQTNQWAWISGDSTVNQKGNYGIKGVASITNKPPARSNSMCCKDKSGNLWMMGGRIRSTTGYDTLFNDLWKFDIITHLWIWISGDSSVNMPAIYGPKGISTSYIKPGSLTKATCWADTLGNIWLFGGFGYSNTTNYGENELNDLWKYNINNNQWTYLSGDTDYHSLAVFGVKGLPSITNCPLEREAGLVWTDNSGNIWLFGGDKYSDILCDLWKYDITTNMWSWINGDSTPNSKTIFGLKGISSSNNKFGSRDYPINWKDKQGDFWIMGGGVFNPSTNNFDSTYSDVWKYNINKNQWTWMYGDSLANKPPVYGNKLTPSTYNSPGLRMVSATCEDNADNVWVFGGFVEKSTTNEGMTNELWKYNKITNEWTWFSGDSTFFETGDYSSKGIYSATNKPGARYYPFCWADNTGHIWITGGQGFGKSTLGYLNDIWEFIPGNNSTYNLNGKFISTKNNTIKDVTINYFGSSIGSTIADTNGSYNLSLSNSNYTITPTKNNDINKANGITTTDLVYIQSHILGKSLLNSPYKIIAADVNVDGKITTLDLVYIKRLILGLDTTFTNSTTKENRLWAFIDSSYKFPDSTNPFPFKDSISYIGLSANKTNQTFIGVKLGDVNWDWNPALAKMPSPVFVKPKKMNISY